MAKNKKQDSSWKNVKDWSTGKDKLKNGIMQHPEEDPGLKSIYNFMKSEVKRNIWVSKFKDFENVGKK